MRPADRGLYEFDLKEKLHPEDLEIWEPLLHQIARGRRIPNLSGEIRLIDADGNWELLHITPSSVTTTDTDFITITFKVKPVFPENDVARIDAFYDSLFEANQDAMVMFTLDNSLLPGKFTRVNQAASRLSGYTSEELQNMSLQDIEVYQQDNNATDYRINELLTHGYFNTATSIRTKNRGVLNVDVSAILVFYRSQPVILSSVREPLSAGINYQTMFHKIPFGIFIADDTGRYIEVNPAAEVITGYSREELIGMPLVNLVSSDSRIAGVQHFNNLRQNKESTIEIGIIKKGGEKGVCQVTGVALPDKKFLGFVRDITVQKHLQAQLQENQEEMTHIIDSAPDAIFIQTDYKFAYINEAGLRLFGATTRDEIIGTPVIEWFVPDQREAVAERIRQLNESRIPAINRVETITTKDERIVKLEVSAVPYTYMQHRGALVFAKDVTEREEHEKLIRESEQKYRRFFEADLAAHFSASKSGELLDCNQEFLNIFRLPSKEAALKLNLNKLYFSPSQRVFLYRTLEKEGKIERVEREMRTYTGSKVTILLNMTALYDNEGRFTGSTGFLLDITEQKKVQTELVKSEQRYRYLFDTMQEAFAYHKIIIKNHKPVDYEFITVNPKFEELTGLSSEQIIGKTVLQVFPKTEKYWIDTYGRVALTGNSTVFESFSAELNRHFKVTAYSPEYGTFATIFTDVSEDRRRDRIIRQLSTAVEQSPIMILITDLNGIIEYVNPAFTSNTGYTPEDTLGKTPRILRSGLFADHMYEKMWEAIKKGEQWSGKINNRKKDGSLYFASLTISPVRDEKGNITHFLGIQEDITNARSMEQELKIYQDNLQELVIARTRQLQATNNQLLQEIEKERQTELMLQKAYEREKEINEMKSRFISTTSHEFRTPLTAILSSTELIQRYRHKWDDEKIDEHFARIHTSINYLTRLLDDVLTISRAESGKLNFSPIEIDVSKYLNEILSEFQPMTPEHCTVVFKDSIKSRNCKLDARLLKFIIYNLLSNAIKYSPDGGKIILTAKIHRGYGIFSLSDEGIGIPKQDLPKIFEPFSRAENAGIFPGTGLGLSIVKRAVDLHNGSVKAESQLGKGTKVIVKIPLV